MPSRYGVLGLSGSLWTSSENILTPKSSEGKYTASGNGKGLNQLILVDVHAFKSLNKKKV